MKAHLIQLREFVKALKFLSWDFISLKRSLKQHNLIVRPQLLFSWTSEVIFLKHRAGSDHLFIKVYASHKTREKKIGDYLKSTSETSFVLPVKYIEIGEYSIYTFPYQVGITLKDAIERRAQKELNYFLENILDLLVQLNSYTVTHCDLTPQNIIIDTCGSLKIIDFEFAIIRDHPSLCMHDEAEEVFLENLGGKYKVGNNLDNESFIIGILRIHRFLLMSINRHQYDFVLKNINFTSE